MKPRNWTSRLAAHVAACLLMVACGDKITVPPAVPETPSFVVRSVTVVPGSATLQTGDKITLSAAVNADAGVTDRTVTWTTSNAAIASVDQNGVVTAGSTAGNATITAASKVDAAIKGAAIITVIAAAIPASTTSFAGTGTAATNTCGFSATTQVTGSIAVAVGGAVGTLVMTHVGAGVTFTTPITITNNGSTATFTGTGSQVIGGQTFSTSDSGTATATSATDTQTLTRQGSSPCTVVYNHVLQKQ